MRYNIVYVKEGLAWCSRIDNTVYLHIGLVDSSNMWHSLRRRILDHELGHLARNNWWDNLIYDVESVVYGCFDWELFHFMRTYPRTFLGLLPLRVCGEDVLVDGTALFRYGLSFLLGAIIGVLTK